MGSASAAGGGGGNLSTSVVGLCDRETALHGYPGAVWYGPIVDEHSGHEHHNYQLVLYGVSLLFMGGAVLEHYLEISKWGLPYTMILLLFGGLVGTWVLLDPNFTLQPGMKAGSVAWGGRVLQCDVTEYVANDLFAEGSHFGNAVRLLAEMDPHLLLHLLLPPLLFESAFAIDWHIFSKVSGYALFLALPGLIVATLLTGATYMALYGWAWEACMLIGGILSATDPVAVVALLREMGVKKSLATLIEAESLMNDGTAVVVYSILLRAVRFGSLDTWLAANGNDYSYILWMFVRMSVIGPLFGAACAAGTLLFIQGRIHQPDRDHHVETVVTIAAPFFVFYVAETAFGESFQMSGVLAVVAFGLVYASPWGSIRVDPRAVHFLHEFWGMVGHIVNLIIFVMAGIMILLKIGNTERATLAIDMGLGLLVYVLLALYRGIVMFGVIPLFRHSQYGYTWKDALVVTWGGLRGAVGLALAVAVSTDATIVDCATVASMAHGSGSQANAVCIPHGDRIKNVCILHTCLTVLLTLVVNASTSGYLLRRLGMTALSAQKRSMVTLVAEQLATLKVEQLTAISKHAVLKDVVWEGMQRLVDFEGTIAQVPPRCDLPMPS